MQSWLYVGASPSLTKGGFTLGSKTEETPKWTRHPTGQEQNFGPKEFTLGSMSNEVVLKWYHIPSKSLQSLLLRITPSNLRNQSSN